MPWNALKMMGFFIKRKLTSINREITFSFYVTICELHKVLICGLNLWRTIEKWWSIGQVPSKKYHVSRIINDTLYLCIVAFNAFWITIGNCSICLCWRPCGGYCRAALDGMVCLWHVYYHYDIAIALFRECACVYKAISMPLRNV